MSVQYTIELYAGREINTSPSQKKLIFFRKPAQKHPLHVPMEQKNGAM
jgi:hypothetical protein